MQNPWNISLRQVYLIFMYPVEAPYPRKPNQQPKHTLERSYISYYNLHLQVIRLDRRYHQYIFPRTKHVDQNKAVEIVTTKASFSNALQKLIFKELKIIPNPIFIVTTRFRNILQRYEHVNLRVTTTRTTYHQTIRLHFGSSFKSKKYWLKFKRFAKSHYHSCRQ